MAAVSKQRSFRTEREFGLVVGGVLVLLSGWWILRGKFLHLSHVTVSLGALHVLLGLLFPRALVIPNKGWIALAEVLSYVSTRIILAFVFFVVVTPIGLIK